MLKILGLIPARRGSQGVPNKNLRPLNGTPLVTRACTVARESGVLDRIVLSTDSPDIAQLVGTTGVEVPFARPAQLAADHTPMIDVVSHALEVLAEGGYEADAVMLLQPTSPTRTPEHLRKAVQLLGTSDAVCSVIPLPPERSPHFLMKIERSYLLHFMPDGQLFTRRQDVPRAYARDGTVYLTRTSVLREGSFYGARCVPLILQPHESVNIDSEEDWASAERKLAGREGASRPSETRTDEISSRRSAQSGGSRA